MNKVHVTDEMLYQCMPVLETKLLENLPSDDALTMEPSEQFQKNMEQLIKRAELKENWGVPIQTWKRVAAAIIVTLVGMLTVSMSVKAVREKIVELIQTVYEECISISYYHVEEQKFEPFEIGYIPEGYELAIESLDEESHYQSFEKQEAERICMVSIMQQQIREGLVIDVDTEYINTENCEVQGCLAEIGYKENGNIHVMWENKGCKWVVVAQGTEKEEVLKVCESLH